MNRPRCVLFLQLTTVLAYGQTAHQSGPADRPKQAVALVQSFYRQVAVHETFGLPSDGEWKIYVPYLSKGLRHTMDLTHICAADYDRQDALRHGQPLKSPFSLEMGLFSGNDDPEARPSFEMGRELPQQDGSFLVYVRLKTLWPPPTKPVLWEIAARVVWEDGHPVIDDIRYVDDASESLSKLLTSGCDGPRWVGK